MTPSKWPAVQVKELCESAIELLSSHPLDEETWIDVTNDLERAHHIAETEASRLVLQENHPSIVAAD